MKKFIKTTLSAMLALAVGVMPSVAVGVTDSAGESANTVRKFTPVVDGVIEEEYLSSYGMNYKWDETDRELCYGTGGFGFWSRDEDGNVICGDDGTAAPGDDTLYGWDCGVEAYFLWDDECIYIALDVTDDDYACLTDEALQRAKDPIITDYAPNLNDCVSISLKKENLQSKISTERGGRFIAVDEIFSVGQICDIASWNDGGESDPTQIYVAKETDHGYIMEFRIPIAEEQRSEILRDGGQLSCFISITDSSPDSGLTYGDFSLNESTAEDEKDLAYVDSIMLGIPEFLLTLSDEAAVGTTGANIVRRFTPVVDGVIDEEYLSSFRIDHEWPEERTPDNYLGSGKFAFDEESGETAYGWDAQASSYFLWDDESIYIAFEITDDDYGCIDDEHYQIAFENIGWTEYDIHGPILQDAVVFALAYGDQSASILLTRDGRVLCKILPTYIEDDSWCDVVTWLMYLEDTTESYYAAQETENGYVLELCLTVKEDMRSEMLRDGATFDFEGISLNDSPADAEYLTIGEIIMQDWYRPDDSWLFSDVMQLGARYKTEDSSLTLTLSDEEAVALPPYDLTADGVFDTKDLTRLMRFIAGDSAAVVAQSADINEDGAVDVKDLTRMMKHLAK